MPRRAQSVIRQSAVIPWRKARKGKGIEILLISASRRRRWVIPKGLIEPDLSAAESAAKEALEEAGVVGELDRRRIGTYKYQKCCGTCRVEVYSLRVIELLDEWEEDDRERYWRRPKAAAKLVEESKLAKMLRGFSGRKAIRH